MEKNMLKNDIRVKRKNGLCYIFESDNRIKRFKPWLSDSFSFLYDHIMTNSILPKKLAADIVKHYEILNTELKYVHGERILELATGTGSVVNFLPSDNYYTGTDISTGLLRKAVKNLQIAGFKEADLYVTSADDIPFDDNIFSICLCILSFNFFDNIKKVVQEIKRVLIPEGVFICSVPVPERNKSKNTIRGTLYSEKELALIFKEHGFQFESIPEENGALLYFIAMVK